MNARNFQHDQSLPAHFISVTSRSDGALVVSPDNGNELPAMEPFPLPPMALSNSMWLASLGNALWRRRGRCLAAWLVLDCRSHRWLPPLIPRQKCGRDGAMWRLDPADFADLPPHCRLGGSFQTRAAAGPEDAAGSVPPLDGLHIVEGIGGQGHTMYMFVRADGVTHCVSPDGVMVNDWQQTLDAHWGRLELL